MRADATFEVVNLVPAAGGLAIDADGTHRIWFEYDLSPAG
jgi:hypothetical protein